jgi:threonine aldolase
MLGALPGLCYHRHIMRRRNFLAAPLAAAFDLSAADSSSDDRVDATGDGVHHTPQEYARLLARLTEGDAVAPDSYSIGGAVEKLESRMAALLGKETAVWLPTGTLANHLAVRILAGSRRRVLVQADSHLFNDEGDCAQTLSGLTLVPLARGKATFTIGEVEAAAYDAQGGRVATPIGAIQIETPVRRHQGERFDFDEIRRIVTWARSHNVGLHLDGARLFLESAYTNRGVREYAALFDTVYVSMYKYFNAAAGAILAGPKPLLADLFHTRRMFGGGLPHVWPYAAVALHYQEGFETRFRKGVENSETVIQSLNRNSNFGIERIANGTNIFRLRVFNINAPVYKMRLFDAGVTTGDPVNEWFSMQVNETWARTSAAEITRRFVQALG